MVVSTSSSPRDPVQHTEERLVGPSTTSNDTNHTTHAALDNLLRARGELDTGLALVWVVADDSNVVARSPSERTTVANLLLHVSNNGTLRA